MDKQEKIVFQKLTVTMILLLIIGPVFYHLQEGFGWVDSIYFSVITLTTVGYGDFSPQTVAGKLFTVLYLIIGLGVFATYISMMAKRRVIRRTERKISREEKAQ